MMSNSNGGSGATSGDMDSSNPYSDSKYQRFSASIERTLKSFELAKETQEISTCLAKLHKALLAYTHFKALPHKHLLCRHLAQSLNPNHPSTIHLKVLEIYRVVFDRIGKEGLSRDLFLFTNGLYPLFDHGSTQVRPQLLELYDQYLLPLGTDLLPGLQGLVMALLPGLEEGSECIPRVRSLLDSISFISVSAFTITLWNILYRCHSLRLYAAEFILDHLKKRKSHICQALKRINENQEIFVLALCSALYDSNVPVVRHTLDIMALLLPLNNSSLPSSQVTMIVTGALATLTKREPSLSRRVYTWLLGNLQPGSPVTSSHSDLTNGSSEDGASMYLTSFVYPRITAAIKSTLSLTEINLAVKSFNRSEHLIAHRILKSLVERTELHELLLNLMPDYLIYLKYQMKQISRVPSGSLSDSVQQLMAGNQASLREDIFINANQYLCGLDSSLLWGWMEQFLLTDISNARDKISELVDRKQLILTLIRFLPQQNCQPVVSFHLPNLILSWIKEISVTPFDSIPQLKLVSFASFISSLFNLLNQFIQSLSTGKTTSPFAINENSLFAESFNNCQCMSHDCHMDLPEPNAPPTLTVPSSNEGEGTTPTVFQSLLNHLQVIFNTTLNLLNKYVTDTVVNARDGEELIVTKDTIMEEMQAVSNKDMKNRLSCCNQHAELVVRELCRSVLMSVNMLVSVSGNVPLKEPQESINGDDLVPSYYGLMMCCLRTSNVHVFIASLNALMRLWKIEKEGAAILNLVGSDMKCRRDFIKIVSVLLWESILTHSTLIAHHPDAADLLYDIHALTLPLSVVEDVILEKFAQATVVPYQVFMTFWKHTLFHRDTNIFKRLLLRVLEGLQCTDPFILLTTTNWIRTLSKTNQLSTVLLPLYSLIIETTPPKRLPQYESPQTPKPYSSHAQYYFNSLPLPEEQPIKEATPPYPLFYFTQMVDAPRLQYGLSLFLSLLAVEPVVICTHLASTYMAHSSGYSSPVEPIEPSIDKPKPSRPTSLNSSVAKSLLELLLTYCSHMLLTDYSSKLNIQEQDMIALTNIKITAVNVIVNMSHSIAMMSHGSGANKPSSSGDGTNISNSTYVLCLLALCEVQKATLIGLLQLIDIFKSIPNHGTPSPSESQPTSLSHSLYVSLPHLQPLFIQLLKALYFGISLESMATNIAESPIAKRTSRKVDHSNSDSTSLNYIPGVSIVLQPLFFHILNTILSRNHLVLQQTYLLSVICHSMLHFRESLEVIAPKLLKQVYRNLKELLIGKAKGVDEGSNISRTSSIADDIESPIENTSSNSTSISCQSDELIAVYIMTISHIVHYCLLCKHQSIVHPDQTSPGPDSSTEVTNPVLYFKLVDPFLSLPSLQLSTKLNASITNDHSTVTTPSTPSTSSDKPPFSLGGWLLGGMFASSNGTEEAEGDRREEGGAKPSEYCGVYAPTGQKILWQLQHVYGVIVRVWNISRDSNACTLPMRKDLNNLVRRFLQPMVAHDSTLFYTTVAHAWMHWNLVGKSKQHTRESFIQLLHQYKLQSLVELIGSVSNTLDGMVRESKEESNRDRQKYLLHFLHCYISSPFQSKEELSASFTAIMCFLKDSQYTLCEHNYTDDCTTSLLSMLTSILHTYVRHSRIPDHQTNKKQRKDLQDMIYKLCELLATIVENNVSSKLQIYQHQITLQQSSKVNGGKYSSDDKQSKGGAKGVASPIGQFNPNDCEVQALALLGNVLACFIDKVYNDERDRVSYLLKAVFKPVWMILKSLCPPTKLVYLQAVKLLMAVSEYHITRKYWRDEVMELMLDMGFFSMDRASLHYWKVIVNNLVSQDKTVFSSILSRLPQPPAVPTPGMIGTLEQDRRYRSKVLKRLSFIILSGDHNQYISHISEIIEKLTDSVSHYSNNAVINSQVLLVLRVLLIKISGDGLVTVWPLLVSEVTSALIELQSDLGIELTTPQAVSRERLYWYWSACRLLETISTLPDHILPHWQLISWGFFGVTFEESLEKDIAETSISNNEDLESPHSPTDTENGNNTVTQDVANGNGSMTTPTSDRWSIIDDVLKVYKEHSQDTKQVKLPSVTRLPMAYEVKTVKQLVGYLQYLSNRETSALGSMMAATSAGYNRRGGGGVAIEELIRTITYDFID